MRAAPLFLTFLLASAATAQIAPSAADMSGDAERCSALIGQQIRPGVNITQAQLIPASPAQSGSPDGAAPQSALPAHCLVQGRIDDYTGLNDVQYGIGFELALPVQWNGRFLMQGGGGLNGVIRPPLGPVAAGDNPALARGFAVVSHDGGHQSPRFNRAFMADQRAALNFAETAVLTVTQIGKALTENYYGQSIGYSYMTGCSTGGREGMLAAQRYPELFDGIVIGAPAMRTGISDLMMEYATVQFNQAAPRDANGRPLSEHTFSTADRQTILNGLLKQCDALDGRADGMIMNVAQCNFRPAELQCSGEKRDDCLSAAQVGALDRAFAGAFDAAGYPIYVPMPYDTGIVDVSRQPPGYLPTGADNQNGPVSRALEIDMDARVRASRADAVQRLTDTHAWTALNHFLGRGGKLMFFHGVSDPWFSAFDTWDYWERAAKTNGASFTDASRFYMIPGMSHCRAGNAFDQFDLLSPMIDWVERGRAPGTIEAWRHDSPDRRPLCQHPAYAHYDGGDASKASSYSCRSPD